ncbi:MAG: hypothetical protein HY819_20005 [Acidobacteria bacterium]|nr:hypothetical protein [Acidobacteriota bacterium]
MDIFNLSLYIAGIFLLIKGLQYSLVWVKLMRERQQVLCHEWIAPSEIPEKFTPVWVEADQALSQLGFQYAYAQRVKIASQDTFYYIYVHPELAIFANTSPTLLSSGSRPFDVVFTSIFENSEIATTTDCLNNIELPYSSNVHCQTLFLGDLQEHLQAHITLVNKLRFSKQTRLIYPTIDDHLAIENQYEQSSFSYRVSQGLIVPIGNEQVWRYSAIGALKLIQPIFSASKKLSNATKANAIKALASPLKTSDTQTDPRTNAQLVASVTAFERVLEDEKRKQAWGWMTKTVLFVVSVIVTAIAFGFTFSWKTVPIFLGILFIHELGHLVGMKLFGYKDTQILFLPFLGAVTIGEKENVTPMQKLVIYLLGPVPGVIGGFIAGYIYLLTGKDIWYEIALMAIIINYINLLPILPLDGGRVVEAIFFSRFPRAQSIVYIINTCILVLFYFLLHDKILLFLIIASTLSIPYQWRFGKAAKEVSNLLPPEHNRTNRLEAIFQVLNTQPAFLKQALPEKHLLAKQLLSYFSNATPTLKTMVTGGIIYFLMLGLPIGGVVGWVAVNWFTMYGFTSSSNQTLTSEKIEKPNWDEKIKQATDDEKRWQALMDAARNFYDEDEKETNNKAKSYYLQALEIAKTFPAPDLRYIDNLTELGDITPKEESRNYYLQALDYAEKNHPTNNLELAKLLERLSSSYSLETQEKIKCLEKALEIRKNQPVNSSTPSKGEDKIYGGSPDLSIMISHQSYLASLYEENKEFNKAEDCLKNTLSLCKSNKTLENRIVYVVEKLADFYLRQEKVSLAKEILIETLEQQKLILLQKKEKPYDVGFEQSVLISHLAWVCVIDKDFSKANEFFEESLKLKLNSIAQEDKSWVNWLISKMYSVDKSFITLQNFLDLCYIQLQQGKLEEAKITFNKVKNIVTSLKGQTLETYHKSLDRNAKYTASIAKQKLISKDIDQTNRKDDKKFEDFEDSEDSEDFEVLKAFQNPPEIDLTDPLIEKAKQSDWQLLRTLAHKEVFDRLK